MLVNDFYTAEAQGPYETASIGRLELEEGGVIEDCWLAYATAGELNADKSNYVDLIGGGELRMKYNNVDNLRLTGRYTLNNGEMKYSLPVIPLKTFTIQDGSYIEFTGDPMNPRLNITATEHNKATVSSDGGAERSVDFTCGVVISKTLNNMGLEFIIDAPQDMSVSNQLNTMSKEERGKIAVTMLTTSTCRLVSTTPQMQQVPSTPIIRSSLLNVFGTIVFVLSLVEKYHQALMLLGRISSSLITYHLNIVSMRHLLSISNFSTIVTATIGSKAMWVNMVQVSSGAVRYLHLETFLNSMIATSFCYLLIHLLKPVPTALKTKSK